MVHNLPSIEVMEVRPPNYGEAAYFGTGVEGSFNHAQPVVFAALVTVLFALVVWPGNLKTAGLTPQTENAGSADAQSEHRSFPWVP